LIYNTPRYRYTIAVTTVANMPPTLPIKLFTKQGYWI